jgi:hypothetical protein
MKDNTCLYLFLFLVLILIIRDNLLIEGHDPRFDGYHPTQDTHNICGNGLDCHYGTCNAETGECDCNNGWRGDYCNKLSSFYGHAPLWQNTLNCEEKNNSYECELEYNRPLNDYAQSLHPHELNYDIVLPPIRWNEDPHPRGGLSCFDDDLTCTGEHIGDNCENNIPYDINDPVRLGIAHWHHLHDSPPIDGSHAESAYRNSGRCYEDFVHWMMYRADDEGDGRGGGQGGQPYCNYPKWVDGVLTPTNPCPNNGVCSLDLAANPEQGPDRKRDKIICQKPN